MDYWVLMHEGKRTIFLWDSNKNVFENKPFASLLTTCDGCKDFPEIDSRVIPEFYTSAYIDINKDCKSDLVIETTDGKQRYLEFFYYNQSKLGYIGSSKIPQSYSLGQFQDINANNLVDIIFFDKADKKLKFFLNDFEREMPDISKSYCLDKFSAYFPYKSLEDGPDYKYDQELQIKELNFDQTLEAYEILKFGDINLDGYVDLLMNVKTVAGNRFLLLQNTDCNDEQQK